ncbi:MAG: hypothetical protein ACPG4T_00795 [Nannocystaceae bacterium]
MGMSVLVTGGYFDEGADGVVHHVELDTGHVATWARWRPPEHLAVPRKGLTGAQRNDTHLYCAAHAAVVRWNLRSARVDGVLHQPDFNDLHDLALGDQELLIVNTGCDAVERFRLDGTFVARHTWQPGWVQARRIQGEDLDNFDSVCRVDWTGEAPHWSSRTNADDYHSHPGERPHLSFARARVVDRVHPNHVVCVAGEWLVTCLYDGSLRSLGSMTTRLTIPGHPHDGVLAEDGLWFTTIDGGVWRAPRPIGQVPAVRVAEAFSPGRVGWCRGLLVTPEYLIVGLTEVRHGRLPKHHWADANPEDSVTGLVVLDRHTHAQQRFIDLTDRARHHKIYSIVEVV